jgi:hypothetical protein
MTHIIVHMFGLPCAASRAQTWLTPVRVLRQWHGLDLRPGADSHLGRRHLFSRGMPVVG